MQLLKPLLLSILLVTGSLANAISLEEALKKGSISLTITSHNGEYYGECIAITIYNKTSHKLSIEIEPGYYLYPDDSTEQRMIIAEQMMFALQGNDSLQKTVNAFCTQMHDDSPSLNSGFSLGKKAKDYLLDLTKLVNKHKYFGIAAQNAVWCLTDNQDIFTINSPDETENNILRGFIYKATGQSLMKKYSKADEVDRVLTISDTITYSDREGGNYSFFMEDEDGNEIFALYKNKYQKPAYSTTRTFTVTVTNFRTGKYYIILSKENGRIIYKKEIVVE